LFGSDTAETVPPEFIFKKQQTGVKFSGGKAPDRIAFNENFTVTFLQYTSPGASRHPLQRGTFQGIGVVLAK